MKTPRETNFTSRNNLSNEIINSSLLLRVYRIAIMKKNLVLFSKSRRKRQPNEKMAKITFVSNRTDSKVEINCDKQVDIAPFPLCTPVLIKESIVFLRSHIFHYFLQLRLQLLRTLPASQPPYQYIRLLLQVLVLHII